MIGGGIEFTVVGRPVPAGSKRAFKAKNSDAIIVADSSGARGKSWRQEVSAAAAAAMEGAEMLLGPVSMTVVFYRARPKAHYRADGSVKDNAPRYPVARPDVLKLARAVEDAMTGIVFRDDAQIVGESLLKRWGEPERVEVWAAGTSS